MLRALDFINSIGVNTRIPYADGDYRNGGAILSALQWLGVVHVRDFGVWNKWVDQSNYALLANAGIKFDMVIQTNRSPEDFISQVAAFDQAHAGSVVAIEGPNEIDLFPPSYNGLIGAAAGVAIVNRLSELALVNPFLSHAMTIDLTGAVVADMARFDNVHDYSHNGSQPLAMLSNSVTTRLRLEPGKPLVVTETGYLTGRGTAAWQGVDEATQAKLTLNLLLDAKKLGVTQTYLFQLFDAYPDPTGSKIDANMGLFKYGYAPKESALALHDLTAILADHGMNASTFNATELNFHVANLPASGDELAMEKSDGTYDIALWAEPNIWNSTTHSPIAVTPTQSTVDFSGVHHDVRIFDPLISSQPIAVYSNVTSVQVPISDHPVIVEVTLPGSIKNVLAAATPALAEASAGTTIAAAESSSGLGSQAYDSETRSSVGTYLDGSIFVDPLFINDALPQHRAQIAHLVTEFFDGHSVNPQIEPPALFMDGFFGHHFVASGECIF